MDRLCYIKFDLLMSSDEIKSYYSVDLLVYENDKDGTVKFETIGELRLCYSPVSQAAKVELQTYLMFQCTL